MAGPVYIHSLLLTPSSSLEAAPGRDHKEEGEWGQGRCFPAGPYVGCVPNQRSEFLAGFTALHLAYDPLSAPIPNKHASPGTDLPDNHKPAVIKALLSFRTNLERQQQSCILYTASKNPKERHMVQEAQTGAGKYR